jgi:hypothetical protein
VIEGFGTHLLKRLGGVASRTTGVSGNSLGQVRKIEAAVVDVRMTRTAFGLRAVEDAWLDQVTVWLPFRLQLDVVYFDWQPRCEPADCGWLCVNLGGTPGDRRFVRALVARFTSDS